MVGVWSLVAFEDFVVRFGDWYRAVIRAAAEVRAAEAEAAGGQTPAQTAFA